jgi:rhodanese-related sulfurtransferase/DUF971 family protein
MSVQTKPVPRSVSRANRHDVLIDWSDGHRSLYPARELRLGCRCASCIEEMTGRPILNAASVPADVHPLSIQPVGRYALHLAWSDGHTSGIYTFEHLRSLCRCSICRPDDPDAVNPPVSKEARPMPTITAASTMEEVLSAYPGAQRALFAKYHIGGCSSCGFQPTDTLEDVCRNHEIYDVESVIDFIRGSAEVERKIQITPEALKAKMDKGEKIKLLDLRGPQEIAQAHIDGAQPVTEELSEQIINRWDKNTPIVLFCHLGERSQQAAFFLSDRGFTNVKSLAGGIDAWSMKVDPKVPRYQQMGGGGCKG